MKKIKLLILTLLALSLFWGCGKAQPEHPETAPKTETQTDEKTPSEETEEKTPAEKPEKEYPDVIETAIATGYLTPESIETNTPCQVRVLKVRDLEKTEEIYYDLCVEIDTGTKILKKKLVEYYTFAPRIDELRFADVDGDGTEEMILHHDTGGNGGFGMYYNWVLKVDKDAIQVLYEDPNSPGLYIGFESKMVDGYQMEVTNELTGYTLAFDAKQYEKYCFDENGKVTGDVSFIMDSLFFSFEPKDIDGDNVYEIEGKRYTSLIGRVDYIGTACCILKLNVQSQEFEVIDAWYEPYIEE